MSHQRVGVIAAVIASIVVMTLVVGTLIRLAGPQKPTPIVMPALTPDMVTKATEAMAVAQAAADFRQATSRWNELLSHRPDDRDLILNQAVTALEWLHQVSQRIDSGKVNDRSGRSQLERELHDSRNLCDKMLVKLSDLSKRNSAKEGADLRQTLIEAAILEARAHEFDGENALKLRTASAEKLLAGLATHPSDPNLSGLLAHLFDPLGTHADPMQTKICEAVWQAWRDNPRNAFLAMHSCDILVKRRDKRFLEPLATTIELAQPVRASISEAEALRLDQLVEEVGQAVEANDWTITARVSQWLKRFADTEPYLSNRGALQSDIGKLLDDSFIQRWRSELSKH